MAIRVRQGDFIDFDGNKLLPGESGLVLDKGELYFCYSPGNTKKLQTAEDLQNLLNASPEAYAALQQLITDLTNDPNELSNILSNISSLQDNKLDKTGDTKDNIATFTEVETDTDIVSGDVHSTIFGKILKSIKTLRGALADKIDKTSIAQTTETNDPTKVAASSITHDLQNQINDLSETLDVTETACVIPAGYAVNGRNSVVKTGKDVRVLLNIKADSAHTLNSVFATIPEGYRPTTIESVFSCTFDAAATVVYPCAVLIGTDGTIRITISSGTLGMYVLVDMTYKTY